MTAKFFLAHQEPLVKPPAWLGRWQVWAAAVLLLLIPFFLPIPRSLRLHPIIGHLGDQLHIPLLGAIYLMIYWRGPLRGRILLGALAAAVVGGAIEFLQVTVGRGALLRDWFLDLQGIGLVMAFLFWRGKGLRLGLVGLCSVAIVISLQNLYIPGLILADLECRERFPVLDDFESSSSKYLWGTQGDAQLRFAPSGETGQGRVLRVLAPERSWVAASMQHFPCDWSRFEQLVFSARSGSAGVDSLSFGVRLDDWPGRVDKQWIGDRFTATSQWQVFRLPLTDRLVHNGERIFSVEDVMHVIFDFNPPARETTLEIDDLYLQ